MKNKACVTFQCSACLRGRRRRRRRIEANQTEELHGTYSPVRPPLVIGSEWLKLKCSEKKEAEAEEEVDGEVRQRGFLAARFLTYFMVFHSPVRHEYLLLEKREKEKKKKQPDLQKKTSIAVTFHRPGRAISLGECGILKHSLKINAVRKLLSPRSLRLSGFASLNCTYWFIFLPYR